MARRRQKLGPDFTLGSPFMATRHSWLEGEGGLKICFDGFGHAHGSRGIDADGNEIHFTRGWYDFSLGLQGEPGHLMIKLPPDESSAPIVGRWRGFQVTVLKDVGRSSLIVRVDVVEGDAADGDADDEAPDIDAEAPGISSERGIPLARGQPRPGLWGRLCALLGR